jgi:hypothetical protein
MRQITLQGTFTTFPNYLQEDVNNLCEQYTILSIACSLDRKGKEFQKSWHEMLAMVNRSCFLFPPQKENPFNSQQLIQEIHFEYTAWVLVPISNPKFNWLKDCTSSQFHKFKKFSGFKLHLTNDNRTIICMLSSPPKSELFSLKEKRGSELSQNGRASEINPSSHP